MNEIENTNYDVIIIGGGITGAGTARDCSMRGLSVLLFERFDYTNGATGRNHGLLHSGARYAVNDQESASECISENKILKRIAKNCVEQTTGLFVTLPDDDISFQDKFVDRCIHSGIDAVPITPKEALDLEPSVNPSLIGAVRVPDGAVDPFRLTMANIVDARSKGAVTRSFHEVIGFIRKQDKIVGVRVLDLYKKEEKSYYASVIVNAAGIWGHHIAELAGVTVNMFPAKGALLIFGHRVNNVVLNRCRKPSDADILVPGDTICVIGTTSSKVPYDEIDNMRVTTDEVKILLNEGTKLAPILSSTRILRAYAGVRPLVAADNDPSGRNISRGIVLLDHEKRDGLGGFVTITGGKLMTYRLMAEKATDLVCQKLGLDKKCMTADFALPGSRETASDGIDKETSSYTPPVSVLKAAKNRHGELRKNIALESKYDASLLCECESVSLGEVKYALKDLDANNLISLRRRTRLGMGTCQGELCACRAAGIISKSHVCGIKAKSDLERFLNERWKGMYPIAWGDCLRENQYSLWVYRNVCGIGTNIEKEK